MKPLKTVGEVVDIFLKKMDTEEPGGWLTPFEPHSGDQIADWLRTELTSLLSGIEEGIGNRIKMIGQADTVEEAIKYIERKNFGQPARSNFDAEILGLVHGLRNALDIINQAKGK